MELAAAGDGYGATNMTPISVTNPLPSGADSAEPDSWLRTSGELCKLGLSEGCIAAGGGMGSSGPADFESVPNGKTVAVREVQKAVCRGRSRTINNYGCPIMRSKSVADDEFQPAVYMSQMQTKQNWHNCRMADQQWCFAPRPDHFCNRTGTFAPSSWQFVAGEASSQAVGTRVSYLSAIRKLVVKGCLSPITKPI